MRLYCHQSNARSTTLALAVALRLYMRQDKTLENLSTRNQDLLELCPRAYNQSEFLRNILALLSLG